ncbi:hypothetical protein GCM10010844_33120 [Deinococcus radiotolerans]|uniref:Transposase n=1 Tax=Deinococcus radiotolerans TaxID=1309407 RepID=A0ABQ2FNL3_9DEIO|nr:hypothetical protein GCM10010844_33120 [Deinococcus radiotolerans]
MTGEGRLRPVRLASCRMVWAVTQHVWSGVKPPGGWNGCSDWPDLWMTVQALWIRVEGGLQLSSISIFTIAKLSDNNHAYA